MKISNSILHILTVMVIIQFITYSCFNTCEPCDNFLGERINTELPYQKGDKVTFECNEKDTTYVVLRDYKAPAGTKYCLGEKPDDCFGYIRMIIGDYVAITMQLSNIYSNELIYKDYFDIDEGFGINHFKFSNDTTIILSSKEYTAKHYIPVDTVHWLLNGQYYYEYWVSTDRKLLGYVACTKGISYKWNLKEN